MGLRRRKGLRARSRGSWGSSGGAAASRGPFICWDARGEVRRTPGDGDCPGRRELERGRRGSPPNPPSRGSFVQEGRMEPRVCFLRRTQAQPGTAAPQQLRFPQPRFCSCKHPGRATARGRDVGHGVPPPGLGTGTGNGHPVPSHLGKQHPGLHSQSLLQNQSLWAGDEAAARQLLEQGQAPNIPGRARALPFAPRSRISRCLRCLGSSPPQKKGLAAPLLPPGPCGNLSSQETLAGGKGG